MLGKILVFIYQLIIPNKNTNICSKVQFDIRETIKWPLMWNIIIELIYNIIYILTDRKINLQTRIVGWDY